MASHHPTVDPILGELRTELADLAPRTPKIPLITTVADDPAAVPAFDAAYWVDNLRKPVRFGRAVTEAAASHATFVEVSPHPLLTHAINGTLESARPRGDVQVGGTLYRDNPETLSFHTQLADLGSSAKSAPGSETDGGARSFIDLPPTPWQHVRYWTSASAAARQPAHAHPLLGQHVEMPTGDHVWQGDVGTDAVPYMVDHIVHGQAVMPATGFAEIALAAGCEALGLPPERVAVNRVEVEQMLRLDGSTPVTTQLLGSDGEKRVEIHSRAADGNWRRHAVATVEAIAPATPPARVVAASSADGTVVAPADLVAEVAERVGAGMRRSEAVAAVAKEFGVSRRELYALVVAPSGEA